ncbi:cytochrome P450 [Streptomyces sp. NPDC002088]|uniref:cytochrome P450 n=1 Tax=Streptomyces sp. NPDC002088 TaxID=3154665 RepID=UPI003329F874
MPASQARIPTGRAERYLTQLCAHISKLSRTDLTGAAPLRHGHGEGSADSMPRRVESSGPGGVVDFGWGRCTLRADGENLVLRAEADDQQRLQRIQDAIAQRLERIGRHDGLTVTWRPTPPEAGTAAPADGPESAAAIIEALTAPAGRADPYPLYAAAHRIGPVLAVAADTFLVCGYAAVNQVLRNPGFGLPDTTPNHPEDAADQAGADALRSMSRSILRTNPPDHSRMRSLISQVFTPRRVASLQPSVVDAVDTLLDRLAESTADGRTVDFMDQFAFQLPVTVICELLGVPPADRHRFRRLASDLTTALELSGGATRSEGPADAAARELAGYFTHLIGERRNAPGNDLVSALVAARDADDGRLSDEELLANLILLLVAGFETTTDLLGNGLAILLDRPDLAAALRSGQTATAGFVEEVLRYDSPVQVTTRVARADALDVEGIPIPTGSNVILLLGAANRDAARYPHPDSFDPTRTGNKPVSFGAGPHICIGNSLARLEASTAFPRLLDRFPALSADPDHKPTRRDRLVLRGYQTLPVGVGTSRPGPGPAPTARLSAPGT